MQYEKNHIKRDEMAVLRNYILYTNHIQRDTPVTVNLNISVSKEVPPLSPRLLLQAVRSGSVLRLRSGRRHLALLPAPRAAPPQDLQTHPQSPPRVHRE